MSENEKYWTVDINIVEKRRAALIEAPPRKEAIRKLRDLEWEELGDAQQYIVTKVGPCVELSTRPESE